MRPNGHTVSDYDLPRGVGVVRTRASAAARSPIGTVVGRRVVDDAVVPVVVRRRPSGAVKRKFQTPPPRLVHVDVVALESARDSNVVPRSQRAPACHRHPQGRLETPSSVVVIASPTWWNTKVPRHSPSHPPRRRSSRKWASQSEGDGKDGLRPPPTAARLEEEASRRTRE